MPNGEIRRPQRKRQLLRCKGFGKSRANGKKEVKIQIY